MKRTKTILLMVLLLLWGSYIIWEIQVQQWVASQIDGSTIIRVDLILMLPILIAFTVHVIYVSFRDLKK